MYYKGASVIGPGKERGMVLQEYSLLPWRTVADNVSLGPEFAGMDAKKRREIAMDYLARVGLEKFAEAKPHELSDGMRRRAASLKKQTSRSSVRAAARRRATARQPSGYPNFWNRTKKTEEERIYEQRR